MQPTRRPDAAPGDADALLEQDPGDLLRTPLQAARGTLDLILCGEGGPLCASLLPLLGELRQALDQLESAIERTLPGVVRRLD
jgi:hypothetical protein